MDKANGESERSWKVRASRESHDCVNPVRSCEEIYFKEALEKRDKSKELIKVSIGESEREGGSCEIVKLPIMCSAKQWLTIICNKVNMSLPLIVVINEQLVNGVKVC